jgi:hypothetical protein
MSLLSQSAAEIQANRLEKELKQLIKFKKIKIKTQQPPKKNKSTVLEPINFSFSYPSSFLTSIYPSL